MTPPQARSRQARLLDAGDLQPETISFRLHLSAGGKAATTVRTYPEAVRWFASRLITQAGRTRWEEVAKHDVQRWIAWLLDCYSSAHVSNQFRALQQFFKWLAVGEGSPDSMAGLKPPSVPTSPVPVFTGAELKRLQRASACQSRRN